MSEQQLCMPRPPSTSDEAVKASAEEEKARGNALYAEKKYFSAMACYSRGLGCVEDAQDAGGAVWRALLSNRCACYLALEDFPAALRDALQLTGQCGDWTKAWYRLACCYEGLCCGGEAVKAAERGLMLDAEDALLMDKLSVLQREVATREEDAEKERNARAGGDFGEVPQTTRVGADCGTAFQEHGLKLQRALVDKGVVVSGLAVHLYGEEKGAGRSSMGLHGLVRAKKGAWVVCSVCVCVLGSVMFSNSYACQYPLFLSLSLRAYIQHFLPRRRHALRPRGRSSDHSRCAGQPSRTCNHCC
jgi:tetratricopeptide (TPR) repeat protein